MKFAGFSLLVAGWAIVAVAVAILPSVSTREVFTLSGILVELLGLVLVVRSHLAPVEKE